MSSLSRAIRCLSGISALAVAAAAQAQASPAPISPSTPPPPTAAATTPAEAPVPPTPADALDQAASSSTGLADIVVTAQKRSENLQTVPIAVTAISGAALTSRAAVTLQALQGTVPNVQINNFSNTPQTAVFAIRGIGVIEPDPYAGNTVSIVYDGVPQFFSMGALLDLYDIDRVEILRGPQGTLFGANTTGGVVNVVTRQPTGDWGFRGQATYGNYNRFDIAGALDFPIGDGFSGKAVVSHTQSDGYTTNVFNGKSMGDKDVTIFRGYLKYQSGDFDATAIGEYDRVRDGAPIFINGSVPGEAQYVAPGTQPPGSDLPMYASPCVPAGQPCHAPDHYYSANDSTPDLSNMDNYRATLTMNLRNTGIGDITSITGYKWFDLKEFTDQDGSPVFLSDTRRHTRGWQVSEELRTAAKLTGWWNLIGGLFYMGTHYSHSQDYRLQFAAPGLLQNGLQDQDNYQISGFVQNYFQIASGLRAQAGLRFSHEYTQMLASTVTSINLSGMTDYDGTGNVLIGTVAPPLGKKSWNNVGWKLGLDYTVRPGMLLYGYWARGFKSGVFTGRIGLPSDLGPASPEHVDTFEAGIKSDFLDHHVRINLAGFYTNYRDIQLATIYFQQNGVNTVQGNSIINAASAHIKGFELEGTVLPVRGLTLTGSLAYLDARYNHFPFYNANTVNGVPIGLQDLSGLQLQNAPKWNATAAATYEVNMGPGKLLIHGQYEYNSSRYMYALNDTPRALVQPVNLVDGNIDYTWKQYTLSVWGTNLFDKRYISSLYDAPGVEGLGAYMPPRRYGRNRQGQLLMDDAANFAVRLSAVEAELARHRDQRAIEDLLSRYSRALDWLDDAAIADIFWDDAEIDYGFFKGSGRDFKPLLMNLEHQVGRRWHFTAQVKIALDGDVADVESYNFTVAAEKVVADGESPLMHFYGTYIDRFERRGSRWAIIRRRHLLVGGAFIPEAAMVGEFALLNAIGAATPEHPEYRNLVKA